MPALAAPHPAQDTRSAAVTGLSAPTHPIVLTAPQAPRMNAIMERWVGSVRREILDRMLIIKAAHLRKVLSEYESHFNGHRPHRPLNHATPLRPLPDPLDAHVTVIRRPRPRRPPPHTS